jgi:hypothetical protein
MRWYFKLTRKVPPKKYEINQIRWYISGRRYLEGCGFSPNMRETYETMRETEGREEGEKEIEGGGEREGGRERETGRESERKRETEREKQREKNTVGITGIED